MIKRANFLFIEKQDDIYTISMTPELQDDVGTVGFVEYFEQDQLEAGDPILNLEASKTVLEIESPIKGEVVERNEKLSQEPMLLNSSKKDENWVVKLKHVDTEAFKALEDE